MCQNREDFTQLRSLIQMLSLVPSYISAKPRERIIKTGKGVLAACELHPERSLAEHYNPLVMAPELLKAHDALDREVDKAMGTPRKLTTERQRQEILFTNYVSMTSTT